MTALTRSPLSVESASGSLGTMHERVICAVIGLICVIMAAPPVRAGDEEPRSEAIEAFEQGRELLEQEKYEEACLAFERSRRLDPAPGTLLNLALCHEKLGNIASAVATYREAASVAASENDPRRERVARERAEALEPRVSKLKVVLEGPSSAGLVVMLSDREITGDLGKAVAIDPGEYELTASAPGRRSWHLSVPIVEKDRHVQLIVPVLKVAVNNTSRRGDVIRDVRKRLAERLVRADEPRTKPPSAANLVRDGRTETSESGAPGGDAGRSAPSLRRRAAFETAGKVTTGAGLVAVAAGLGFGLHARSRWQSAQEHCEENLCTPLGADLAASANLSANAANILVGMGIASSLTGLIIWASAPASEAAEGPVPATASVTANASPHRVGLSINGKF